MGCNQLYKPESQIKYIGKTGAYVDILDYKWSPQDPPSSLQYLPYASNV